ncbi:hypothetical protein GCM10022251_27420 [Phytohabitans flavus]|uniref:Uncharacterized protein n=1 Tax=Phytohabitans flavus TaxID=1076124 RepID=A0A6F8XPD1_9ACTN|nr:hypothetical protein Pflav_020590 [Phytohabitans flavus]
MGGPIWGQRRISRTFPIRTEAADRRKGGSKRGRSPAFAERARPPDHALKCGSNKHRGLATWYDGFEVRCAPSASGDKRPDAASHR